MTDSSYQFSEVMLVIAGQGWLVHQEVRHPVEKGSLILVEAGCCYCYEDQPGEPLAMLSLCLKHDCAAYDFIKLVLPCGVCVHRHPHLSRIAASHLRVILLEQSGSFGDSAGLVLGETLLLLTQLSRFRKSGEMLDVTGGVNFEKIGTPARVRSYVEQLEKRCHEPETIQSAADRLKISVRSFTYHFRKITGQSHLNYLRSLRLARSRFLLRETNHSVTSIAFACGFDDLSTFFRAFRKHEGMSPSQWRTASRSS
jgi:AraC family L-rhamnose operon regulatory protein RhaS